MRAFRLTTTGPSRDGATMCVQSSKPDAVNKNTVNSFLIKTDNTNMPYTWSKTPGICSKYIVLSQPLKTELLIPVIVVWGFFKFQGTNNKTRTQMSQNIHISISDVKFLSIREHKGSAVFLMG